MSNCKETVEEIIKEDTNFMALPFIKDNVTLELKIHDFADLLRTVGDDIKHEDLQSLKETIESTVSADADEATGALNCFFQALKVFMFDIISYRTK